MYILRIQLYNHIPKTEIQIYMHKYERNTVYTCINTKTEYTYTIHRYNMHTVYKYGIIPV
jgi:hypothetical protein